MASDFYVKLLTGKTVVLKVDYYKTTVADLKPLIQQQEGLPVEEQHFLFTGSVPPCCRLLSEYAHLHNNVFHCILQSCPDPIYLGQPPPGVAQAMSHLFPASLAEIVLEYASVAWPLPQSRHDKGGHDPGCMLNEARSVVKVSTPTISVALTENLPLVVVSDAACAADALQEAVVDHGSTRLWVCMLELAEGEEKSRFDNSPLVPLSLLEEAPWPDRVDDSRLVRFTLESGQVGVRVNKPGFKPGALYCMLLLTERSMITQKRRMLTWPPTKDTIVSLLSAKRVMLGWNLHQWNVFQYRPTSSSKTQSSACINM